MHFLIILVQTNNGIRANNERSIWKTQTFSYWSSTFVDSSHQLNTKIKSLVKINELQLPNVSYLFKENKIFSSNFTYLLNNCNINTYSNLRSSLSRPLIWVILYVSTDYLVLSFHTIQGDEPGCMPKYSYWSHNGSLFYSPVDQIQHMQTYLFSNNQTERKIFSP